MADGSSHQLLDFPVVLKNKISKWKVLNYTKEDWCKAFREKVLRFRQGKKTHTDTPYWERFCEFKEITLNSFFELPSENSNHWLYFDYKYVKDVFSFLEGETFLHEFNWTDVGLFGVNEEESTLWIGNEGAHTPCHMDTYGCNVVAQLFGRKFWILIPPTETENLKAVRVPYEESSVFSLFNFYSPNSNLLSVKQAFKVILSPGDVLYVPKHWWHYVENLEPAISINIWVPQDSDHESRLEEALVRYYISNICQDLKEEEAKQILNPNEHNLISKPCTLSLIEKCIENCKEHKRNKFSEKVQIQNKFWDEVIKVDKLCLESYVEEKTKIRNLNPCNQIKWQTVQNNRVLIAEALINSYCHQSNINAVKMELLKREGFYEKFI